jgi:hypothetical protein
MRKTSLIVIATWFTIGCVGLYHLIWVGWGAWNVHRGGVGVPSFTWFAFSHQSWLLGFPIPVISWALLGLRKAGPSADHVALFGATALLLFVGVFFWVVIASIPPWATYMD